MNQRTISRHFKSEDTITEWVDVLIGNTIEENGVEIAERIIAWQIVHLPYKEYPFFIMVTVETWN